MRVLNRGEARRIGIPSRFRGFRLHAFRGLDRLESAVNVRLISWPWVDLDSDVLHDRRILTLYGDPGAGTSRLAAGILMQAYERGAGCLWIDAQEWLVRLKAQISAARSLYHEMLADACLVGLLVLDGVLFGLMTEFESGIIGQIIRGRYNEEKPFIITTNSNRAAMDSEPAAIGSRILGPLEAIPIGIRRTE